MTPDQLHAAGVALYGEHYRESLRQELDVGERILRRWLAGTAPIPDGVAVDVAELMDRRREELLSILLAMENGNNDQTRPAAGHVGEGQRRLRGDTLCEGKPQPD